MNYISYDEAAPAASSAGSTGSEAREGAPSHLEVFLRSETKTLRRRRLADYGLPETPGASYMRLLPSAFAIVSDGCMHLGLVYPEVLPLLRPLFDQPNEVLVRYDGGAVNVHTEYMGNFPIITAREDRTLWRINKDRPETLKEVRLYIIDQGELTEVGRQSARAIVAAR